MLVFDRYGFKHWVRLKDQSYGSIKDGYKKLQRITSSMLSFFMIEHWWHDLLFYVLLTACLSNDVSVMLMLCFEVDRMLKLKSKVMFKSSVKK